MSNKGISSISKSISEDVTNPGTTLNNLTSHLGSEGDIFSENDPNNKKPKPGGDGGDGGVSAAADLGIASRDTQFALRDASVSRAAQAAGATRSENDADLLGYTPNAKRRSASRTLLG